MDIGVKVLGVGIWFSGDCRFLILRSEDVLVG